eukprot:m.203821 g.203821  ORF g.203821 m.203821 type:complete len:67 (-) comp10694_c0_seq5:217-417(-)
MHENIGKVSRCRCWIYFGCKLQHYMCIADIKAHFKSTQVLERGEKIDDLESRSGMLHATGVCSTDF